MTGQSLKISLVKPFCILNCTFNFLSLVFDFCSSLDIRTSPEEVMKCQIR